MDHKRTGHFIWIVIAFSLGISISYVILRGVNVAYGVISSNIGTAIKSRPISDPAPTNLPENPKIMPDLTPEKNTIRIGFVGDIIPGLDAFDNIFDSVSPHTNHQDLMMGNFEGVVTDHTYSKCKIESSNCFAFNGDAKFMNLLKNASFDVLNIANNHFNDFGEIGQEDTLNSIAQHGMTPTGMKNVITYVEKEGITVAVLGVSNYFWANSMESTKTLASLISEADQNADIVVVMFHGGGEGQKYAKTPIGIEWYLNENRGDLRTFARNAIDSGADIVVGSGPHVLRGIEKYKEKLIAYSLGNFASANSVSTLGTLKISALLEVNFKKDGSFVSGRIYPFEIDVYGIPHPDPKGIALYNINALSNEDFGDAGIRVNEYGEIIF